MTTLQSRITAAAAFDEYELTGRETELERLYVSRLHTRLTPLITALARTADMLEDTNRLLKVIMDIHGDRLLDEAMLRDHYNANRSALGALYSLLERGGV